MANIKSQIKRVETNEKRRMRNRSVKSELKTLQRRFHQAIVESDPGAVAAMLALTSKKLDKAASKGVIHKNQAANRKSGMAAVANAFWTDRRATSE